MLIFMLAISTQEKRCPGTELLQWQAWSGPPRFLDPRAGLPCSNYLLKQQPFLDCYFGSWDGVRSGQRSLELNYPILSMVKLQMLIESIDIFIRYTMLGFICSSWLMWVYPQVSKLTLGVLKKNQFWFIKF